MNKIDKPPELEKTPEEAQLIFLEGYEAKRRELMCENLLTVLRTT